MGEIEDACRRDSKTGLSNVWFGCDAGGQGLLGFVFLQAVDCDWIRVVTKSFIRDVLREDVNLV